MNPRSQIDSVVEALGDRFFGKYRSTVVNNEDPTGRARLKVRVPAVMGSAEIWALPCLPLAGAGMGAYLIPEVGAGVWVEFEAGDPSYPIWSGGYWGDGQAPVDNEGTSASATLKVIRSKEGLMVTLNDKDQVITVSDKDGKNVVTIEVMAGKITVKGAAKAIVEAPQIELVENATHPVVFGDQLMTYLNSVVQTYQSHVHPGQLAAGFMPVTPAPPVPPLPPPTPALLSKKVKAG
ncbi:MAG TPA: phage baseplate assembly protein V [Terrimicrobiaceae bacterium]